MNRLYSLLAVVVAFALLVALVTIVPVQLASGAPMALPTPNAAVDRVATPPQMYTFFNASALTADTTSSCFELANHDIVDLYYDIEQGVVNTTTLTLKFGNSETALVDGQAITSTVIVSATALQPYAVYGRYTCIYADVATTDTITITVNALAK